MKTRSQTTKRGWRILVVPVINLAMLLAVACFRSYGPVEGEPEGGPTPDPSSFVASATPVDSQPPAEPIPTQPAYSIALTDSPEIACSELGASWSAGTAPARSDGTGYDTSACTRAVAFPKAEMVMPAVRDPSRWDGARCNDGTPFGFEVQFPRSGKSLDWVIFLKGGGFCDDNAISCARRSSKLSSSPPAEDRAQVDFEGSRGIFNRSPGQNPTFYEANMVYAFYCSSDLWSGNTTQRRQTVADPQGWYFSGQVNGQAMVEVLMQRYGLNDGDSQTRVLLLGESAGGFGVLGNANVLAEILARTAGEGRLKLVSDGGFAPDFEIEGYRMDDAEGPIRDTLERAYDFWGSLLNPLCEQAQIQSGNHPGRCFLGAVAYPFITVPRPNGLGLDLLIQNSTIDSNALGHYEMDDMAADRAAIEKWRAAMFAALDGVEWLFSNGAYPYHTITTNDSERKGWNMSAPDGQNYKDVLTRFWEGGAAERVIFGNP